MKHLYYKLRYRKLYNYWLLKKQRLSTIDFEIRINNYEPRGTVIDLKDLNGRTRRYKLVTWLPFIEKEEKYGGEGLMSEWTLIGYYGEKEFSDMTFKEFLNSYTE